MHNFVSRILKIIALKMMAFRFSFQNHVALERYIIIVDEMRNSLMKITKMERNVQPNTRTNYAYLTEKIDKKLLLFRNTMQSIEKVHYYMK